MLKHRCEGWILPWIYYYFGLCTNLVDYGAKYGINTETSDCGKNPWFMYY